jgi:hypothetical protein
MEDLVSDPELTVFILQQPVFYARNDDNPGSRMRQAGFKRKTYGPSVAECDAMLEACQKE